MTIFHFNTSLYNINLVYILPAFDVEVLREKPWPILLFTITLHYDSKVGHECKNEELLVNTKEQILYRDNLSSTNNKNVFYDLQQIT